MPTNKLTDAKCKAAKPTDRPYKLFDGGGLFLFVSPSGAKTWRAAYRFAGKPKTKSFGPYPVVPLAVARQKLVELKTSLRDGIDPMIKSRRHNSLSFANACDTYWDGRHDVSPRYRDNATRALEMYIFPSLGDRDMSGITRDDLLAALQTVDTAGHHVYVRKIRMWAGQVFDWAIENGYATINPAAMIRPEKAFGRAKVKNFPALDPRDVPEFLHRLSFEKDLNSVLACRMLALTWARTGELRMMEWEEINDNIWIIPAGKMKRRRDHVVPLSRQALAIIDEMRSRAAPHAPYVFPAPHRPDRPMSENAILYLIARIGYRGRMTGHGWRSIASTWANEQGYSPDAIERQLAHSPDNKIRAIYNRAEYLPLRREMLQAWADWLDARDGGRESVFEQ
jgi:integrase